MHYVVLVFGSYLLGSVTFSYFVGKWIRGIDIRDHGSGNAGATNALRLLGKGPAVFVFISDLLKGVLAVWLGIWFAPDALWVAAACGIFAVVGHNWPIFFRFKGGKGIATTIGVTLTLSFYPALAAVLITVIIIALTRYVSLGSLSFAVFLPLFIWLMNLSLEVFIASVCLAILAFIRHHSNILKLINGQENKLGSGKRQSVLKGK